MIDLIASIIEQNKQQPRMLIDELKQEFISITNFFEYVSRPMIDTVLPLRDIDVPSSFKYNDFLTSIENDINLIYGIQTEINDKSLSSWNSVESSYPDLSEESIYDDKFILENTKANIFGTTISLGISSFSSHISKIVDKPVLLATSSDPNIPVFYGKAWGAYVPGDESSEDGIRPNRNDGSVIVDGADTFWEAEGVVLQSERDQTTFLQPVYNKDLTLTATIKVVFTESVSINTFKIRPYNSAASAYYKIAKIEVSDGLIIQPVKFREQFVITETIVNFITPEAMSNGKIKSIFITLSQDVGYYIKYSLGFFKIKNNESWVDLTGSHVAEEATKISSNFNQNVSYLIENADDWIISYWLPKVPYIDKPEWQTGYGDNGIITVPSSESDRKRYTIGITDIDVGMSEFADISELVTKEIEVQEGYNQISLQTDDIGSINYYVSVNDGMNWTRIVPLNHPDIRENDLRLIPKTLYINSDLSSERKRNTDTGEKAFLTMTGKKIRVRIVLQKDQDVLPVIYSWNIVWGK